jgi:predicted SAM-dependent methyltransferase
VRKVTPWSMRQSAKLHGTTLLKPLAKRKAQEIARGRTDLKLHLGCGPIKLEGWVNVDILGMHPDLYWDLRHGVPFPDGSAQCIFLEHVLEHFALGDIMPLLADCRRVLVPGGVLRVGVPDLGRYMRSYAGDGSLIDELRPGRPTALLAVAEVTQFHGHRSAWDAETLETVLREAGFDEVAEKQFGESRLEPAPDSEMRRPETVYAEGIRPLR